MLDFDVGYKLQCGFGFNSWLRLRWLDFDAWLRATKWLRLQWLATASMAWLQCLATSWKLALASMAGCGYNGLAWYDAWLRPTKWLPCYEVKNGLGFYGWLPATKWLRLQWLTEWLWLQWLRLQWLAAATMAKLQTWLRSPMTSASMARNKTRNKTARAYNWCHVRTHLTPPGPLPLRGATVHL